jgi:hypothetical protein
MRQRLHCRLYPTMMDRARQVLALGVPPGVRRLYCTLADYSGVACSTLYRCAHGGPLKEDKADS